MKHTPEQLNLWDRLFNRHRKEVIERGKERWKCIDGFYKTTDYYYTRNFVVYRIVDRLTGSERIKKEYLN